MMSSCEATERWPYFFKLAVGTSVKNIVNMADEELRKILGEDADPAPEEEKEEGEKPADEEPKEDPEVKAKREQLENLNKAITESQAILKKNRKDIKESKTAPADEEEDLPKINLEDPSAKAWDKRIRDSVAPNAELLERAKEERRTFALRQFLADKPALAANPEKLRETMVTYERLKNATELTTEGILEDLDRAYAATHHRELTGGSREERIQRAREEQLLADPGISRGSTTYTSDKPKKRVYSEEERDILKQWERAGAPPLE